jgi:hypothetical protein
MGEVCSRKARAYAAVRRFLGVQPPDPARRGSAPRTPRPVVVSLPALGPVSVSLPALGPVSVSLPALGPVSVSLLAPQPVVASLPAPPVSGVCSDP